MDRALREAFISASLRFRKVDFCLAPQAGFHFGELVVLSTVTASGYTAGGRLNVTEIQQRLHVSKPAVSQILNSLEKKGCITRRIDPSDRRKIAVAATPKGDALLKQTNAGYEDAMCELFSRFGEENTKNLAELLNRFADVYEQIKMEQEC